MDILGRKPGVSTRAVIASCVANMGASTGRPPRKRVVPSCRGLPPEGSLPTPPAPPINPLLPILAGNAQVEIILDHPLHDLKPDGHFGGHIASQQVRVMLIHGRTRQTAGAVRAARHWTGAPDVSACPGAGQGRQGTAIGIMALRTLERPHYLPPRLARQALQMAVLHAIRALRGREHVVGLGRLTSRTDTAPWQSSWPMVSSPRTRSAMRLRPLPAPLLNRMPGAPPARGVSACSTG